MLTVRDWLAQFATIWVIILPKKSTSSGHESKPSEPCDGCCFILLVSGVFGVGGT